jgi:hypothetical protein
MASLALHSGSSGRHRRPLEPVVRLTVLCRPLVMNWLPFGQFIFMHQPRSLSRG